MRAAGWQLPGYSTVDPPGGGCRMRAFRARAHRRRTAVFRRNHTENDGSARASEARSRARVRHVPSLRLFGVHSRECRMRDAACAGGRAWSLGRQHQGNPRSQYSKLGHGGRGVRIRQRSRSLGAMGAAAPGGDEGARTARGVAGTAAMVDHGAPAIGVALNVRISASLSFPQRPFLLAVGPSTRESQKVDYEVAQRSRIDLWVACRCRKALLSVTTFGTLPFDTSTRRESLQKHATR